MPQKKKKHRGFTFNKLEDWNIDAEKGINERIEKR